MEHIAMQNPKRVFNDVKESPLICRCSKRKIAPYDRVAPGDKVYLKRGKLIEVSASVSNAISKEYDDIGEIRNLCKEARLLYDANSFWEERRSRRYATVAWLTKHEVLPKPIRPKARAYGSGWIVLDSKKKREEWLGLNN